MTTIDPSQAVEMPTNAQQYRLQKLAEYSNEQRMAMTVQFTQGVLAISLGGLQSQFSHLAPEIFAQKVAQAWLGERWPVGFKIKGNPMTWIQDSLALARRLHHIFEGLEIDYYVTGGIAATTYGEPRSTIDLDLVIHVFGTDLYPLVVALEADNFYIPGVEDVVAGRLNTLQITDQITIAQADLIVAGRGAWDATQLDRRLQINDIYLASPEDVILNKLKWRQQSQSEKQWRDVLGILKVQGNRLDFAYLQTWAQALNVIADLEQAMAQSGFNAFPH